MDVRTGMIPFSTTVTKDALARKTKDDLDLGETRDRIMSQAGLATVNDIGGKIVEFLHE